MLLREETKCDTMHSHKMVSRFLILKIALYRHYFSVFQPMILCRSIQDFVKLILIIFNVVCKPFQT